MKMLTPDEKKELHNVIVKFTALVNWMSSNRDKVNSRHWKAYHKLDDRYEELKSRN